MAPEGGEGTVGAVAHPSESVSPPLERNVMPVGEFVTENRVLMLRKITFIRLYSPPARESGNLPPPPPVGQMANPGAIRASDTCKSTNIE